VSALLRDVWVVQLRGFPGESEEVAGVFASRDDAARYAAWWNLEELRKFGRSSTATAVVEETDFYPPGSWRPPQRTSLVSGNQRVERPT
jgi:hypothetical protein